MKCLERMTTAIGNVEKLATEIEDSVMNAMQTGEEPEIENLYNVARATLCNCSAMRRSVKFIREVVENLYHSDR